MFLSKSKLGRAGLAVVGALSLVFGLESEAHASTWFVHDNMEGVPPWSFDGGGPHSGAWSTTQYYSPVRSAYLTAGYNAWSTVGRMVNIPTGLTTCNAEFLVRVATPQPLVIEVIDPVTWTYLAYTSVEISTVNSWRIATGDNFSIPSGRNVYVRATINSIQIAYVDDMYVWCQ
ncbi:MAG TPA: hypothetical protein VNW92_25285 [Polyangiaceae bacterium]|jgi:hypothetical protein|nr:hypothetical protein [Polyangiaceae bacterium]